MSVRDESAAAPLRLVHCPSPEPRSPRVAGPTGFYRTTVNRTVAGKLFYRVLSFSNSTTASIPLNLIDDSIVSGQRALIIDLQINANTYFIGGQPSHIVLINDNDARWTGTLIPASGESASQTFRVKITHQGANTAATFGAGAGSDGLPVPKVAASPAGTPAITATSVSESLIPKGTWPATLMADTAARFSISSPGLPASTGELLGYLWASTNIPAGRDRTFTGDWNNDGIVNGVAYVFGNTPFSLVRAGRIPLPPPIPADGNVFLDRTITLNSWTTRVSWVDGAAPAYGSNFSIVGNEVVDGLSAPGGKDFYRYRVVKR